MRLWNEMRTMHTLAQVCTAAKTVEADAEAEQAVVTLVAAAKVEAVLGIHFTT